MKSQKLQQQEFQFEEKQQNMFMRQQSQRSQNQQNYENMQYGKDDYSRGLQSKSYFNDDEDQNNAIYDQNYNGHFPIQNNGFSPQDDEDQDDDEGPPGLEEIEESSPLGRPQLNNNPINSTQGKLKQFSFFKIKNIDQKNGLDTKSSMSAMKDLYKNLPSKTGENQMKKEQDIANVGKNLVTKINSNKVKAVQQFNDQLHSNRSRNGQSKLSDELDPLDGLNGKGIRGIGESDLNEEQLQSIKKVDPIDISKLKQKSSGKDNKIDDEGKNDITNENEGDNGQNKYEEIYQYILKINKFINITGEKIDIIPKLQKSQRLLEQQIQSYEEGYRIQVQANNEEKRNYKSSNNPQQKSQMNKYDSYLECYKELIQSKTETLKYLKDYLKLIKESNFQSKICHKMGNILVEFHSIIQEDLNNLKYYNNTIPSKQETEYKEKMEALQTQLEQEQEQRRKLEEELNKRIIDFQQLFCDAQEAKKIIKEQLLDIKEQKDKLKFQNLELERKQQEFKKQMAQQNQQGKEQQKDNFDAESRRSDRTAGMSSNYLSTVFKHKVQTAKQQREEDLHHSLSSNEPKEARRKKYDFVMNEENRQFSDDGEENENSYLESYGDNQTSQKDLEYKYEQSVLKNLPYSKQFEQGLLASQIQQHQQSDGKVNKLASPPGNVIQPSPQASPLNNTQNTQNQLSSNIKMNVQKSVAKSALKKKLSDHVADDELKQSSQVNLGLFDFNVVIDESQPMNSNYLRNSGSHNRFLSSGNKQMFGSTTQSFYNKSMVPVSSFNNSTFHNYNEPQQNNQSTLRSMIQSIQNQQTQLKQDMSNYSILNN